MKQRTVGCRQTGKTQKRRQTGRGNKEEWEEDGQGETKNSGRQTDRGNIEQWEADGNKEQKADGQGKQRTVGGRKAKEEMDGKEKPEV